MRVPFDEVFEVLPDGSIGSRVSVQVGAVRMTPGISFSGAVTFNGIKVDELRGMDLDVDAEGDLMILRGYFHNC